jgi:hypothetical protein
VGSVEAFLDTIDATGGLSVTFTTLADHGFVAGEQVTISGLTGDYAVVNGSYPIRETPTTTSFRVAFSSTLSAGSVVGGIALSPSPSYVRYAPHDTLIDTITSHTMMNAEPWDYNTVRVVWGTDNDLDARAAKDVAEGRIPKIVITRSGFGYPVTPLDGVQVLSADYETVVPSATRRNTAGYVETAPAADGNAWNRPPTLAQSLYDRNLPSGHWFYYTLFFYLGRYDTTTGAFIEQVWVAASSIDATTVSNEGHAQKLYDLLPSYYQSSDQEFTDGTGRNGVVERLLQTVGFEVDYTKTLADMLEHLYDIDTTHDDLLHSLGVFNFGIPVEAVLGDIRYRSLLATVSKLYEERGSASGLQQMTNAATKYRCKILDGSNQMNLTDDAEFASGTGSWGNPSERYSDFLVQLPWLGGPITTFNLVTLESAGLETTPEGSAVSLVDRHNAMLVGARRLGYPFDSPEVRFDDPAIRFDGGAPVSIGADVPFDDPTVRFDYPLSFDGLGQVDGAVLVACGLGLGFRPGRRHELVETEFYPRLQGIRCTSGKAYTFSGYSRLVTDPGGPTGLISIGIMWFNDVQDGVFVIDRDYLGKNEAATSAEVPPSTDFRRYSLTATAPAAARGEPYVYAVPYFIFSSAVARYISACMFNPQVNSADDFTLPVDPFLRLGVPSETLDSEFVLGASL